jgi:hypothetical protein
VTAAAGLLVRSCHLIVCLKDCDSTWWEAHAFRRQAAAALPAAGLHCIGVGFGDVGRPELAQPDRADRRLDVRADYGAVGRVAARRDLRAHVVEPSVEILGDGDLARLEIGSALELGDQPGAFNLCLPLRSTKRMPAALALAGLGVAHVDDDGEVAARPFTDVAFMFDPPCCACCAPN